MELFQFMNTSFIWYNVFFYLFVGMFIAFSGGIMIIMKVLCKKNNEIKLIQQQHIARVDIIRKENEDKLDNIRVEMLKREEERSRQWIESEKETLHVLHGVSSILDLTDKIESDKSNEILKILNDIQEKVKNLTIK